MSARWTIDENGGLRYGRFTASIGGPGTSADRAEAWDALVALLARAETAEAALAAAHSVIRHWHGCVRREDDPPMSEWDDIDWAESGWTDAEGAVIRQALDVPDQPKPTDRERVLACGHADDDPTVWHTTPTNDVVCPICCPVCEEDQ